MKRIFIFIGLKVIEVSSVVAAYAVLCSLWDIVEYECKESFWVGGILMLMVCAAVCLSLFMLIILVAAVVEKNWKWAGKISERKKD